MSEAPVVDIETTETPAPLPDRLNQLQMKSSKLISQKDGDISSILDKLNSLQDKRKHPGLFAAKKLDRQIFEARTELSTVKQNFGNENLLVHQEAVVAVMDAGADLESTMIKGKSGGFLDVSQQQLYESLEEFDFPGEDESKRGEEVGERLVDFVGYDNTPELRTTTGVKVIIPKFEQSETNPDLYTLDVEFQTANEDVTNTAKVKVTYDLSQQSLADQIKIDLTLSSGDARYEETGDLDKLKTDFDDLPPMEKMMVVSAFVDGGQKVAKPSIQENVAIPTG